MNGEESKGESVNKIASMSIVAHLQEKYTEFVSAG